MEEFRARASRLATEVEEARFLRALAEIDCPFRDKMSRRSEGPLWDGRYWGVWHGTGGWLMDCDGFIFWTASRKHAEEQMKVSRSLKRFMSIGFDSGLWEVRKIGGQDE